MNEIDKDPVGSGLSCFVDPPVMDLLTLVKD